MKGILLVNASQQDDINQDENPVSSDKDLLFHSKQKSLQQNLQFEQSMLKEREQRVRQIEDDVLDINQIMRELNTLIQQQGENIGESHVRWVWSSSCSCVFNCNSTSYVFVFFSFVRFDRHNWKQYWSCGWWCGGRYIGIGESGRISSEISTKSGNSIDHCYNHRTDCHRIGCGSITQLNISMKTQTTCIIYSVICTQNIYVTNNT